MADAERTLSIRLKADGSGFVGETREASQETDKLARSLEGLGGAVKLATTLLTGYAVATVYGVKQIVDQQDAVGKLSQVYGIQVEQLSAYSHMARLANISNEELALGLRNLIKNMNEAASNTGDGGRLFQALGLTTQGKGIDQVLGEVADKFASFRDGPEKAALAMQLFGRSGERLIPMLNQGSAGIAAVREEAEKLGITFGGDAARQAEQFNDNLTRVNATFTATKIAIANDVLPMLDSMVKKFLEAKKEGDGFFSALFEGLRGGVSDEAAAERDITESVDRRLQLQNDLDRLSRQSGSTAEAERASIERQIARLDEKIAQARALLTVNSPGFFKPEGTTQDQNAPKIVDLTRENALLNQLDDTYAQLTGHVSTYDSVQRKMAEGQKQFDPILRMEIEFMALKIDALRKARIESANYMQVMQGEEELWRAVSEQDKQRTANQLVLYNMAKAANIAAIQDPVVRARAAFDEEVRLREDQLKRDVGNVEDFNKWRVAREAQLNEDIKPQYQKNLDAWGDQTRAMRDNWDRTMLVMQQAGEDFFVSFVTTGKASIADLGRAIEAELVRSVYRQGVSAVRSGNFSWGALFGLSGSGDAGSSAVSAPADYGAYFHDGGIVGSSAAPIRTVPAGTFIGAPRLHSGLGPNEFPAILERGETVTPRGAAGTGQVINANLNVTLQAAGASPGTVDQIRSMLRVEMPGILMMHKRALVAVLNDHRIESGRERL